MQFIGGGIGKYLKITIEVRRFFNPDGKFGIA